jgi:hypothetical protein
MISEEEDMDSRRETDFPLGPWTLPHFDIK